MLHGHNVLSVRVLQIIDIFIVPLFPSIFHPSRVDSRSPLNVLGGTTLLYQRFLETLIMVYGRKERAAVCKGPNRIVLAPCTTITTNTASFKCFDKAKTGLK
jgi:hypothetical protein